MSTEPSRGEKIERQVHEDISLQRWKGFASSVAANVVANLATAGVVYAYARFSGLLKTTETTQSIDTGALVVAVIAVVAMGIAFATRRR